MGCHLGDAEALRLLDRRQIILKPDQNRFAVLGLDQRPRNLSIEAPNGGGLIVGVNLDAGLLHVELIEFFRRKRPAVGIGLGIEGEELVRYPLRGTIDQSGPVGRAVGHLFGVERVDRRLYRQDRHRLHPRRGRWAWRAVHTLDEGQAAVIGEGPGTEALLDDQSAGGGQQPEARHLAPAQLGFDDLLPISLGRQGQFFFPTCHDYFPSFFRLTTRMNMLWFSNVIAGQIPVRVV